MPRKPTRNATRARDSEDDIDINEEKDISEDDTMLEMITMLQEYQKRRASKTSTRVAAFQTKKQALYAEARKNADTAVTDGVAYIEQYKKRIMEMKAQEISQDQQMREISAITAKLEDPAGAALAFFPSMFDDLSHRRAAEINESCAALEAHSTDRQLSRRRLIKNAKNRMEEQLEQQHLATDASALIKHYKALLLS